MALCPSCATDNPERAKFCLGCGITPAGLLSGRLHTRDGRLQREASRLIEIVGPTEL